MMMNRLLLCVAVLILGHLLLECWRHGLVGSLWPQDFQGHTPSVGIQLIRV